MIVRKQAGASSRQSRSGTVNGNLNPAGARCSVNDPTWAKAVLTDRFDESITDRGVDDQPDEDRARVELRLLLRRALDSGSLSDADRDLLLDLAHTATMLSAPLRGGRAGLTTPSVAQLVSERHTLAARTIRRHAADALDRLVEVARYRGLTL